MYKADKIVQHAIYPKQYFPLSKTWDVWNKITVADVHRLREEAGFRGQDVYFWLNHPIRYVRLVGSIVQVDTVANGKFLLITLDDCSGANIEIKVERRCDHTVFPAQYLSSTLVKNLDVHMTYGLPCVSIDDNPIDIGTIIRAQGTISTFSKERQLLLKRVSIIRDTNEEAKWWKTVCDWKRSELAEPWILTHEQRLAFDQEIREAELKQRQRSDHRRKIAAKEDRRKEKYERRARKAKLELDAGALKGSDHIARPWD